MLTLKDIKEGLHQRINMYRDKLQDLLKEKSQIEEEIETIKSYLEVAELLYKIEADGGEFVSQSLAKITGPTGELEDQVKRIFAASIIEEAKDVLLKKSKYAGLSLTQAAYILIKKEAKPMHAKNIYQKLVEGGIKIRGKTPITSIAISLKRDKRFKKVAPNTFALVEESLQKSEESQEAWVSERG